jgi:hypothetical protein
MRHVIACARARELFEALKSDAEADTVRAELAKLEQPGD